MFIRTNVRKLDDADRVIQAMDLPAPLNTSEVREAARESLGKVSSRREWRTTSTSPWKKLGTRRR